MMLRRRGLLSISIATAVLATGIAAASEGWTPSAAGSDRARAGGSELSLELRASRFGPVLFDGRRRALYTYSRDAAESRCYGRCAGIWPPFTSKGRVAAGAGVERRWIGTVRRRGGARQVTYRGHPLYRYVHDPRGKVFCNDVFEFGGRWFAVGRDGERP